MVVGANRRGGGGRCELKQRAVDAQARSAGARLVMPGIDIVSANASGWVFVLTVGRRWQRRMRRGCCTLVGGGVSWGEDEEVKGAIYGSCARGAGVMEERAGQGLPDEGPALEIWGKGKAKAARTRRRCTGAVKRNAWTRGFARPPSVAMRADRIADNALSSRLRAQTY